MHIFFLIDGEIGNQIRTKNLIGNYNSYNYKIMLLCKYNLSRLLVMCHKMCPPKNVSPKKDSIESTLSRSVFIKVFDILLD